MIKLDSVGEKVIVTSILTGAAMVISPSGVTEAASNEFLKEEISMNTNQLLHMGHRGRDVRSLQLKLTQKNYFSSTIDGIYGPITETSVRRFQQDYQLAVDGIAGPQTLSALFSSNESEPTYELTLIKRGDRGPEVKKLQERLEETGFYFSSVDGIFGPLTERAVKDYQRANGLSIDGIAGPQTLGHMAGVSITVKNDINDNNQAEIYSPPSTSDQPSPVIIDQNKSKENKSNEQTKAQTGSNQDVISSARSLIGTPYQWGGTTPSGFDCSGFLRYVFKQSGKTIPRTVAQIWNHGSSVSNPKSGDLVFFQTYKSGPSHAGIYIGNNEFIHAGSSTGVTISSLTNSYWSTRYLGAKSIK